MDLLKKLGFLAIVLLILFLFVWALYLPKTDITATIAKTIEEQRSKLDLYFEGVTFQESANGVLYWEIKAKDSSLNKTTNIATLEDAKGTFFRNGKPAMKFISPYVLWDMDRKEYILRTRSASTCGRKAAVREFLEETKKYSSFILPALALTNNEGYFFKAKALNWKLKTQRIVCTGGIYIKKGNLSGTADKLTADVSLEHLMITGNPCVLNLVNGTLNTIEAKSFEVDSINDELTANEGVTLTSDGLRLTARGLVYKQREDTIYFHPEVEMFYQEAQAQSDFAAYRIKKQEITLEKGAKLIRNGSELTGDKVIVSLQKKTFKVTGKTRIVIPEKELQ